MKVIVSGLTASGKSSVATTLALNFGIEYFSASSKLKTLLTKKDFMVWESKKEIDKDFTPFNLVIDSSKINLESVVQLCSDYIIEQQKTTVDNLISRV